MFFQMKYSSPIALLTLACDGQGLTGLWIEGQRHFGANLPGEGVRNREHPFLLAAIDWLERYFSGERPPIGPLPLHPSGTPFQLSVWALLKTLPYGTTITYGELALTLSRQRGRPVSAQAVGQAVARNPIAILLPCHRVLGAGGRLTGYAGGIGIKEALLRLEGITLPLQPAKDSPAPSISSSRPRCSWVNPRNPLYVAYHDLEWGHPVREDRALLEMLILESFQSGLSWECVLNKREAIRTAFENFDLEKICHFGEKEVEAMMNNPRLIRNRRKIRAAIGNARVFRAIREEYTTFSAYLRQWSGEVPIRERGRVRSPLSDSLSSDLRRRGMRFLGSTTLYAFLQAVGIIDGHEKGCFLASGGEED